MFQVSGFVVRPSRVEKRFFVARDLLEHLDVLEGALARLRVGEQSQVVTVTRQALFHWPRRPMIFRVKKRCLLPERSLGPEDDFFAAGSEA